MTQLPQRSLLRKRGRKPVVAETAAALPAYAAGDAARVLTIDHLAEAGDDVGVGVLAELDHDPAAAHLVGDRAGCAGAGEGVEK